MTSIKYLFGDLNTREIICELPLTGVSMDLKLNDWGIFRGTIHYDTSGVSNADIVAATQPGRNFLVVEREDTPIWDGIIWTSVYDSQAKSQNMTARTYEGYPDKQLIDEDFSRTDQEQRNIFRDLWSVMQSNVTRNIGITVPDVFPDVLTRSIDILATEYKTFYQAMTSISNGDDGFDWTISTIRQNNSYVRNLRIGYPFLGSLDAAGLSFDYPGNITNYWKTSNIGDAATNLYMLGAGEGSDMKVGTSVQTDLLESGFKRYDLVISRKDIDDQTQINSIALQQGSLRRPPLSVIKVFLKADIYPTFGSYGLGDTATVSIIDPRHPTGFTTSARIVALAYRPQSDDTVEQAELIFEGDDLNE
jgi:hypothetical protein